MAKVIFPPRPKGAIPHTELPYYESTGQWCAQYKYNGSRNVIHVEPSGGVSVWGRHGGHHLNYAIPVNVKQEILSLPGLKKNTEYWFDSELLSKTSATDTKHKIVLFDVLQIGKYLFLAPNQMTRLDLLSEICGRPTSLDPWRGMGLYISNNLLMAPVFTDRFAEHFNDKIGDEVEGLVLRKKNSALDNFGQKEYEVNWLIRCRHPHKNYNF